MFANCPPIKYSKGMPARLLGAKDFLGNISQSSQKESPHTALTAGGVTF
jgi:hypothetical protein